MVVVYLPFSGGGGNGGLLSLFSKCSPSFEISSFSPPPKPPFPPPKPPSPPPKPPSPPPKLPSPLHKPPSSLTTPLLSFPIFFSRNSSLDLDLTFNDSLRSLENLGDSFTFPSFSNLFFLSPIFPTLSPILPPPPILPPIIPFSPILPPIIPLSPILSPTFLASPPPPTPSLSSIFLNFRIPTISSPNLSSTIPLPTTPPPTTLEATPTLSSSTPLENFILLPSTTNVTSSPPRDPFITSPHFFSFPPSTTPSLPPSTNHPGASIRPLLPSIPLPPILLPSSPFFFQSICIILTLDSLLNSSSISRPLLPLSSFSTNSSPPPICSSLPSL